MRHPVSLLFPTFVLIIASEKSVRGRGRVFVVCARRTNLEDNNQKQGIKNEEKKYLKPQAHVVQTEPCMVNNLSQVRIYKGRFQTRQELEAAEFTLDEDGFLWGE